MNNYSLYRRAWRFAGAPHEESLLKQEEWRALLRQSGLLVRNTYDFDCQEETNFWYVIKDHFEGFEELSPRVRNKIRHALNSFDYQLITFETMHNDSYGIYEETFKDYPIHDRKMNREIFERYLNHCKDRSFDYWGVFDKVTGELVGFCAVNDWQTCCEYGVTGIRSRYKSHGYYPYYGLYYTLNQYYLKDKGYTYVSDSARSITEHSNIHEFLIQNFNFRKAYCHLQVHYNWWMRIAVKVLYPFRKIITIPKVKAILNMESMTR